MKKYVEEFSTLWKELVEKSTESKGDSKGDSSSQEKKEGQGFGEEPMSRVD